MGAALLAARASLRCGAGLVTVNVPEAERTIIQTSLPEAMLMMREQGGDLNKFSAIGIGPALGLGIESMQLIENIFDMYDKPVLIDADALTLLSEHKSYWPVIPPGSVVTPHPAEFDRMFGESGSHEERMDKALQLSVQYPWVIVLKNNSTFIAVNGESFTNSLAMRPRERRFRGRISGMIVALRGKGTIPPSQRRLVCTLHGLSGYCLKRTKHGKSSRNGCDKCIVGLSGKCNPGLTSGAQSMIAH